MQVSRIHQEVARAVTIFALVEAHPTSDGGVYVKTALQTAAGNAYIAAIYFLNYPNEMPKVYITKPAIQKGTGHEYTDGHICYLHPNMWNPGLHDLIFVLERVAKWLNKYEVWRVKGRWPGAAVKH
jgi:hypothetical protein